MNTLPKIRDKKIAIFTDLHLGVHQNNSIWHNIGYEWTDWFIKSLKENQIETVFFTGDFFHSRSEISVSTIQAAANILSKFSKDFRIFMIPGNHDCYYKDKSDVHSLSILDGYSNIHILDTVTKLTVGENNKTVTFCPWGSEYNKIEQSDVILGHFEIESFKMNAHKLCEHGFKPIDLLKLTNLVFSGHFHLNEERVYNEGSIIYIGSPFQLDFGERDSKKGYYTLNTSDLSYVFIENTYSPVHKKILLSELDNYLNIESMKGNFLKIVVDCLMEQDQLDKLIHKCYSFGPLSLSVDHLAMHTGNGDLIDQDLSGVDISKAIVEFVSLLDVEKKEAIIKRTLELYHTNK